MGVGAAVGRDCEPAGVQLRAVGLILGQARALRVPLCARGGCVAVGRQAEESSQFGMRGNGESRDWPRKVSCVLDGFPTLPRERGERSRSDVLPGQVEGTRRGNAGWCLAMSGPLPPPEDAVGKTRGPPRRSKERVRAPVPKSDEVESGLLRRARPRQRIATWLILPLVICLSQRLSHACVSINSFVL